MKSPLLCCLALGWCSTVSLAQQVPLAQAPEPGAVEVVFTDSSHLKLVLRDAKIELSTAYGKLSIPVADIRKIECASHIPEEVLRRIDTLIVNLGSPQFKLRDEASAELLKLKEKAYPALVQAAKSKDMEVVKRAEELLDKIREEIAEENLVFRKNDVVHTEDSKFTGRLVAETLKAQTTQFGEVQLRLAEIQSIRSLQAKAEDEPELPTNALPDPGDLSGYRNQLGQKLTFRVTGAVAGPVWGTDTYTDDSRLATAAVHAGVLKPGKTGNVRVEIVPGQPAYQGTLRNGIATSSFGGHPMSFKILAK